MKLASLFLCVQLSYGAFLQSITLANPLSDKAVRRWPQDASGIDDELAKAKERLAKTKELLAAAKAEAIEAKKDLPPSSLRIVEQMTANADAARAIVAGSKAPQELPEKLQVPQELPKMSKISATKQRSPNKLPYTPKPPSDSCHPGFVDFGPNPGGPILKNLAMHMQVALEQTCVNEYLGCAYDSKDYAFIADAFGGLFQQDTNKVSFKDLLTAGLADLATTGFGKSGKTNGHKRKCPQDFVEERSKYINQVQSAWKAHFAGYDVTLSQVWRALVDTKFHGFIAICDQVGDDLRGDYAGRLRKFVVVRMAAKSKSYRDSWKEMAKSKDPAANPLWLNRALKEADEVRQHL